MESVLTSPVAPAHVRKLVFLGYGGLAIAIAWFWYNSAWSDPLLTITTLAMLSLGVIPTLQWLARNDTGYPIVELLLLTTVPFYAIPALTSHEGLVRFPEAVLLKASLVVIAFQLACITGSRWVSRVQRGTGTASLNSRWQEEILPESRMTFTAYTATFNTVWLVIDGFTDIVPRDLSGTLRAIFTGVSIISIFIQARLWGDGRLQLGQKVFFWVNLLIQITLTLVSLLLINGIGLLFTALIGYFTTARRVPWVPIVLLLPLIAILHNGKTAMRNIYWNEGIPEQKAASLPSYFSQWLSLGVQSNAVSEADASPALTHNLLKRASLFQIVCVAVDTIPDRAPFLDGQSYTIVPAQVIPRFLWPEKPSPHRSVSLMSVQLGLLTQEETETTSIGFGMLTEAYANFGYIGTVVLGITLGSLFRLLSLHTMNSPTFSPAGLVRTLALVWCINAETTMAVWTSSFYQACIAILIPIWLMRPLLASSRDSLEDQ